MNKISFKSPFLFLWSGLKKGLFLVGLVVTLLYFGLLFFLFKSNDVTVDLPERGFIVEMAISGEVVDYQPSKRNLALRLLTNEPKKFNINHLIKTINRITDDSRVKGLMINWSDAKSNLSHQTRLNDALSELRQERPELLIYFYSNNIDRGTLLLSSPANRIAIPPVANILITGPILQLTYFGDAAKKLGIGFTVFKTGPHKAVFEPYVRSTPSEEALTEYKQISKDITADVVQRIAGHREHPIADIESWFSQSLFTVKLALQKGIITDVTYADTLLSELKSDINDQINTQANVIDAIQYLHSSSAIDDAKIAKDSQATLALIDAQGAISHQSTNTSGDGKIYAKSLIEQIKWAKNDNDVKAVVLRITSPGGSAQASEIIWHHLHELAKRKPLVVSMGSVAASGGYYLATAGQKIVAESTTITGSIGVTAVLPEVQDLQEKIGIYFHTISDSDRKRLLSIESKPTELDVALVNAGIQETYQTFLERVSEGRPLSYDDAEKLAGGRIYTGIKAKELGLVDELGDTKTAFRIAKELAGLDPDKFYPVKPYTNKKQGVLSCLIQQGLDNCVLQSQLKSSLSKLSSFSQLANVIELLQSTGQAPQKLTYLPINTNL